MKLNRKGIMMLQEYSKLQKDLHIIDNELSDQYIGDKTSKNDIAIKELREHLRELIENVKSYNIIPRLEEIYKPIEEETEEYLF